MKEDYCPVKQENGLCIIGKKCDHVSCWEIIHYRGTELMDEKHKLWREHRRGQYRGGKLG